jgi:hypothetical protein
MHIAPCIPAAKVVETASITCSHCGSIAPDPPVGVSLADISDMLQHNLNFFMAQVRHIDARPPVDDPIRQKLHWEVHALIMKSWAKAGS